ncbi:MAG: DNA polymerase Y family protein [Pseudomonadota bacterium]
MKRYLSIWLPDWPLDRLRRARLQGRKRNPGEGQAKGSKPFILTEAGAKGLIIVAASAEAKRMGITPGLSFTDARARVPNLIAEEHDPEADTRALRVLADWLVRYTPLVALDGGDGLMLEITGCDHLHGGEAQMADRLCSKLIEDGITARIGVASTPGAASALARGAGKAEDPWSILLDGETKSGLASLPIVTLRLAADTVTLLRRFGLTRIGQLYDIDRKALARRFASRDLAEAVCLRLDQALGLRAEPLDPLRPAPDYAARLQCPEPIETAEAIALGLERLSEDLSADLATLGQGARYFCLSAYRADGVVSRAEITAARPIRDLAHIRRLFAERLSRIDPGFGIDLLVLEARRTDAMAASAMALSGDLAASDMDDVAVAALADRITAKLGEGSVSIRIPQESYLPEAAETEVAFEGTWPECPERQPVFQASRPLRLFDPPERVEALAEVPDGPPVRFVWRRVPRRVARADGPERIAPEWWRYAAPPPSAPSPEGTDRKWLVPKMDPRADAGIIAKARARLEQDEESVAVKTLPRARDYYRVEDVDGRRYWLFRDGLYEDGRGNPPDWYVHGVFA